jgi:hypothetical protein
MMACGSGSRSGRPTAAQTDAWAHLVPWRQRLGSPLANGPEDQPHDFVVEGLVTPFSQPETAYFLPADLLWYRGQDLRQLSLYLRWSLLEQLLSELSPLIVAREIPWILGRNAVGLIGPPDHDVALRRLDAPYDHPIWLFGPVGPDSATPEPAAASGPVRSGPRAAGQVLRRWLPRAKSAGI